MEDKAQIIGLMLVRNEDIYIERAIVNIIEFCDKIIVADNMSSDQTATIVRSLAESNSRIEYTAVKHPSESHLLIEKYAGKKAWIFGVDGDELYDPLGLKKIRKEILEGVYDKWWMIFGNVLNCTSLDRENGMAAGYLSPPSRSMTKLYNFGIIDSWTDCENERLHEGNILFKNGYNEKMRFEYHENKSWEDSAFRCLHLCFLKRSTLEKNADGPIMRDNIMDKKNRGIIRKMMDFAGFSSMSCWKGEKYMRGVLTKKDVGGFF